MSEPKYFNFPIQLIDGIFKDKDKALSDLLYYALYSHSLKLEIEDFPKNSAYDKFVKAWNWYNVTGVDRNKFSRGKQLYDSIPAKSPKVGLNITIFWDFYKNQKDEFQIACLAAFLAIKSVLGDKPYTKMTNFYLWSRMNGMSESVDSIEVLSPIIRKYANEYQTGKIKDELRLSWGLVYYARYTRGFYVSFDKDLKTLITEAEKRRKSTKLKQLRKQEQELVKEVLKSINETRP